MRHLKTISATWLGLLLSFGVIVAAVHAEVEPPKALLEATSHQMFDALNANRDRIKQDPNVTQELIEELLMPHIDFIAASKWVLGQNWDSASKEQKIGFIKAFRTLLLRFYSSALTEYLVNNDEKLEASMMTFQEPGKPANGQITVRSEVHPKSGKAVPINYQMHLTKKGWKVYDVSVEGVSVITTYKTSFASEIQQSGLDALIVSLNERNKRLLAGDKSVLKVNHNQ